MVQHVQLSSRGHRRRCELLTSFPWYLAGGAILLENCLDHREEVLSCVGTAFRAISKGNPWSLAWKASWPVGTYDHVYDAYDYDGEYTHTRVWSGKSGSSITLSWPGTVWPGTIVVSGLSGEHVAFDISAGMTIRTYIDNGLQAVAVADLYGLAGSLGGARWASKVPGSCSGAWAGGLGLVAGYTVALNEVQRDWLDNSMKT